MMVRVIFIIGLFCFFLPPNCYTQSNSDVTQAPQASDPYVWDFGQARKGEVLKHMFVFKNDTQKTINIKDVDTSCGCTASKVKNRTLLPGEATLIEVEFKTKGYSGPTEQYIYVRTDNLDRAIIRFIIKADVVK